VHDYNHAADGIFICRIKQKSPRISGGFLIIPEELLLLACLFLFFLLRHRLALGLHLGIGLRAALGLGADSRLLLFGTEGATDPEVYDRLVKG
jgi:hypothetical protein